LRALLLFVLSLVTAQPALAQGYSLTRQHQFFSCVPSIKPGPLSLGLGFLWANVNGLQFDLVHNSYGVKTGNGLFHPSLEGQATDVGSGGISFENEPAVVTTDNGAGTGGFSLVLVAYEPASASTFGYMFSLGSSTNLMHMSANQLAGSADNVQGNGEIGVWTYDGTGSVNYSTPPSTLGARGYNTSTYVATVSNSVPWTLYRDGVQQTFTHSSAQSTYGSLAGTKAGVGGYHDGSSSVAGSFVMLAAEFNRILSPAESVALSPDPAASLLQCPR
jgi:hypothetical protein